MSLTNTNPMDDTLGVETALRAEQRRAATYRRLAALYHQPTDWPPGLLEGDETPESDTVYIDLETLREAVPEDKPLRLDHAQLFVGPFDLAAPPYESVYVDDETRVMTDATAAVQATYLEAGIDIDMDEPADHVAAELEFVSLLVATECEALAVGEFEAVEHYLDRQYEFLGSHLGRWISELADNICDHADTEFYRLLAEESQRFVEADGQLLADRLEALESSNEDITDVLERITHDSR